MIIILYVVSFILENRSSDLNLMNQAIKPFLLNKTGYFDDTGVEMPNYEKVNEAIAGLDFAIGQLELLLVAYDEPMSNKNFTDAVFIGGKYSDRFDFVKIGRAHV